MSRTIFDHSRGVRSHTFSKARYVDPALVELEWQRIFRRSWLLAGVEQDVARAGDFFVFSIGPEQILISRSDDGALHAFYNVCQHRGLRLVNERCGNARHFRCAYHAWTYANDGALKAVPHRELFAHGLDPAKRSLRPVQVDAWDGMVFICLDDDPIPLRDYLGPIVDHLAAYRFREMEVTDDQTCHLNCNWKAVIDNFGELYHVDFLHPQHRTMVDCWNDTVHLFENGHTGVHVPGGTVSPRFPTPTEPGPILAGQLIAVGLDPADFSGRVSEIRAAIQTRKRALGQSADIDYSAFSDDQLTDAWQYNLFPNVVLSFGADYLWIMRARPDPRDPGRTEFDKISLVRRAPATRATPLPRPQRDVFDYDRVIGGEKSMTVTIDQDVELLKGVQNGLRSAGFDTVWLSEEEARVQHFHGHWDHLMQA